MPRRKKIHKHEDLKVRSGFEKSIAQDLEHKKVDFQYETLKLKYKVPERTATYTPDFLLPNGIIVESKGKFTSADRKKMLLVIEQHPEVDIRMVFMRDQRLSKASNTYYSEWCEKHGIKYAVKQIPDEWLDE